MDDDTSRADAWFERLDLGAKAVIATVLGVLLGLPILAYLVLASLGGDEPD